MIQLFPETNNTEVDPRRAVADEERPPHADRPWIYTNMIASADGGTAVDGLSGALGGSADKAIFGALRSMADLIVAGSSTVSQERYRVPEPDPETQRLRTERGQSPRPRLAVVTGRLELDLELPLFSDPHHRPLIIAPETTPVAKVERFSAAADFVLAGRHGVDLARAMTELASLGVETVLCEGGPSLNGQMIGHGLVDEWNLSLAPHLISGDSKRAAVGPVPEGPPAGMTLRRVWADDDYLFCRWVSSRA